ncbi:MAG: ribulose-phosphate 3-epimerase [Paludibacteraceae bacterium]|nr:ribulose-phosphate 3-epimerase [Paludibacteraceae bacterium]MBR6311305.1 ribulose-phosphate 3-epimerase [Paludibacteraceae bacterium]
MKKMVAPSLLSADFSRLQAEIEMLNNSDADWIHLDIMDGVFVPNISFGFPVLEAVRKYAKKPLDIHLMIVEPQKFIKEFAALNPYMLNVHYEACPHLHRTIQQIKGEGMKAAVTLNPHTPVSLLEDIVCDVDMVLLMSVNPGFGGQKFIENTYKKVAQLKELIAKNGSNAIIEVDGGVNNITAPKLYERGADVLVAGNYVFKSENPQQTIANLKKD